MTSTASKITIAVPSMLRHCTDDRAEFTLTATTVRTALQQIQQACPALYNSVCDETGSVRKHVNLFVNSTLVRGDSAFSALLMPGDVLSIMPAVSGG